MPIALALLISTPAQAQQFAFPTSAAHYEFWYATAYYDHGGNTDWACDSLTYSGHRGTDLGGGSFAGMDEGRDVRAAANGVVVATNDGEFDRCTTGDCPGGGGFGNHVYVAHSSGTETLYAHMKQGSITVQVGDELRCGDRIGEMGSSGFSTGPHLHFQVNDTTGASTDPFEGACDSGVSHWVDQGGYDGLPSLDCDTSWPTCGDLGTLTCGDVINTQNDDLGSTSDHLYWGCSDFLYTGPEVGFQIISSLDEAVTVRLTGLTADLDLFALTDLTCDGLGCLASSTQGQLDDEQLQLSVQADVPLAIVVDGWEGAVSDFQLEVICEGTWTEPVETGTSTATPTTTNSPQTTAVDPVSEAPAQGCACQQSTASPFWLWPSLFALLWRRRIA